jgi:alpha-tubulin suppressor-like RCC1 family protein
MLALPTLVPATADVRFGNVTTGTWHSLALTEEGEVYT